MAAGGGERLLQRVQLARRHAHVDRAGGVRDDRDAGLKEEPLEAVAERVVQDAPALAGLLRPDAAGVVHVVRAVGEAEVGLRSRHQPVEVGHDRGVPAEQPVRPEQPEIAGTADRDLRRFGDVLSRRRRRRPRHSASNASSWSSSASEKPTSDRSKSSAASSCSSPASSASSHGDSASRLSARPVGPALRLGQMPQHDHRRLGQPELRGGQDAAMARDQFAVVGHEARHGPAELGHAGGDLGDLIRPVRLRVAGIGLEPRQRPCLDRVRSEAQGHSVHPVGWRGGVSGVDSALDSTGPRWTPSGVQRKPPPEGGQAIVLLRIFGSRRWTPESGWLPKKTRLSLANCRAAPPSIRSAPGRTRTISGLGGGAEFQLYPSGGRLVRKNHSPSSVLHRLRARANLQPMDFSHAPPEK